MNNEILQEKNNLLTETLNELFPVEMFHTSNKTQPLTFSSLIVAEMAEKDHYQLLKDIRRYNAYFNEGNFDGVKNSDNILSSDFWIPNTYNDSKGETRPCYLITKKGCEFIANKMTGKKGTIFTARYINRFHEMEEQLKTRTTTPPLPDNRLDIAKLLAKASRASVEAIKQLYPEYFTQDIENGSLEHIAEENSSYTKWIEDYGITVDWIGQFPTTDLYNDYMKYCKENRLSGLGKKTFFQVLTWDFHLVKKQCTNGRRYFVSAKA